MRPCPYEVQLLAGPLRLLETLARRVGAEATDARLQILEAASSVRGGFSLPHFYDLAGIRPVMAIDWLQQAGRQILQSIATTPVPVPLALSALAREPVGAAQQRSIGAYYTDFRLARHMAAQVAPFLTPRSQVIDPSSGSGMLLTAIAMAVCGNDPEKTAAWLANSVFAADIAPYALRGVRIALASMTEDLAAVQALSGHLHCLDSLVAPSGAWQDLAAGGFDLVIGNPPWKKIKLSRHEYLSTHGETRHYGAEVADLDTAAFHAEKARHGRYARELAARYPFLGTGDPDLYKAFLELFFRLAKPGGHICALVPAGLIRSQGTQALRQHLFDVAQELHLEILDNHARFFAIDSRFKFLLLSCVTRETDVLRPPTALRLLHAKASGEGIVYGGEASIGREALRRMRPDLTIPEVRSDVEWQIFKTMSGHGTAWAAHAGWRADITREVDMTRDRHHFLAAPSPGALPLVEGRMVHQHRFGVKAYVSGSGRRAHWEALPAGQGRIAPQFWIAPKALGPKARARTNTMRRLL